MSRSLFVVSCLALAILCVPEADGQHCPPIVESYLQSLSVRHTDEGIAIDMEYRKTGGQRKECYQAYVLVYAHADAARLAAMTPQEAIESKLASVVHTQLAQRQADGCYRIQCSLKAPDLVAALLKESRLDPEKIDDFGGWKSFQERIHIAVFVPFLDDEKYSVIEGLPEDRHECNYLGEAALIFETLSQTISVHFGIVQAVVLPEGKYYLQINGGRPLAKIKER